jgi:hypothetical protein
MRSRRPARRVVVLPTPLIRWPVPSGAWPGQQDALRAQEALNTARAEAVEDIEDLDRTLRRARISEAQAARQLEDAQKALAAAQRGGNADKIRDAQLAYDDAAASVEEAHDRTEDLTVEQQHSAQVGVEGSDRVRDALDRQQQAIDRIADAEASLRQARQGSGGGGIADEVTKLAPAAAALVATIKTLKPAWESLRLDVQQRLFAGIAGEIRSLADAWLPALHRQLGGFASTINEVFRALFSTLRQPQVIADLEAGMSAVRDMVGQVGQVVAGPVLDAFSRLARASAPFVRALGDGIAGVLTRFSDWIAAADRSGRLEAFFGRAAGFFRDLMSMGGAVVGIIGSFVSAAFGGAELSGKSPWDQLLSGLQAVDAYFKDPVHREELENFFDGLITAAGIVIDVIGVVGVLAC